MMEDAQSIEMKSVLIGAIVLVIAIEFFLSGFKPIFQDIIAGR